MRLFHVSQIMLVSSLATFGCADTREAIDGEDNDVLAQMMDGGSRSTGADAASGAVRDGGTTRRDAGGDDENDDGADAGSTSSGGGVEMAGTWFTKVDAKAEITAPLVGASVSDVKLALKLFVKQEGGKLVADVSTCDLDTKSGSLSLNFDKVEPHIKLTESIPDFEATVGGKVPLPKVKFVVGQDDSGSSVDADEDGQSGVTVSSTALGAVPFDAYVGLTLSIEMDASLKDEKTVSGTATFDSTAKIFGSGIPLVTSGNVTVKQVQGPVKFDAKHYEGDVPCAKLMDM
ncbi:MAG: hypothetical protein ABW252_08785 [Polyangiales bacterium]